MSFHQLRSPRFNNVLASPPPPPTLYLQSFTASISFVGSTPSVAMAKSMIASLPFTGALTKRTSRSLDGILSFVGSFSAGALFRKSLTAALSFTGTMTKLVGHRMTAAVSFSGILSIGSHYVRSFTASVSFNGAVTRLIRKTIASSLSFVGLLAKLRQGAAPVFTPKTAIINSSSLETTDEGGDNDQILSGANNVATAEGSDTIDNIEG